MLTRSACITFQVSDFDLHLRADVLSDQMAGVTLFLPTNDAVNATLEKFGLDLKGLLENKDLVDQVISYHILPSPIEVRGKGWIPIGGRGRSQLRLMGMWPF